MLEIRPLLVLNISAGFSLTYRGCRIIEADFLRSFLRTPMMTSAVAVRRQRAEAQRVETLYTSEQEASDRFDAVMANPWTLRRFMDRLTHRDVSYPRPTGGTFTIATRFRGDLTALERLWHAEMIRT